jgi:hypothetical protein
MPIGMQTVTINSDTDLDYRDENMVEMLVTCRPLNQALPNGQTVSVGEEKVIRIYESQVPAVEAMVERDIEGLKRAEEHYERELTQHLKTFVADNDPEKATEADWDRARKTFPGSVSASFHTLYHRDILPIIDAKVVQRDLPPPQRKQAARENAELAKQLLSGQGELLKGLAEMMAGREERLIAAASDAAAKAARDVVDEMLGDSKKKGGR